MSLKKKPLKSFFIVFTIVFFFGVLGSVSLRIYKEKISPEKFTDEELLLVEEYSNFPRIENVPTRNVVVGSNFTYAPKIVPMDNSTKLTLLDGPEWLVLEDLLLSGTPRQVGSTKFVLRVEKEGRYIDEEFFLVITEALDE